jgi:Icc protein
MADWIIDDDHKDGIDRRGFLKCMAWAGTGLFWTVGGGLLQSTALGGRSHAGAEAATRATVASQDFTFVQISDSHIGFNKEANKDVTATLQEAVNRINALPARPDFLIHTGDLSHLSKAEEFDTVDQVLKGVRTQTGQVFTVPGEHDVLNDEGKQYRARYGKQTQGGGWYSFDHRGVHFVGLVNVLNLKAGGLGSLGSEQLEWLEKDLKQQRASTPVVVFAHIPLWTVYPEWGWGTDDSAQALSYLKRFGSVTVLNGHIHQILQKVEGNVSFHTAASTAFPQPAPGKAPSPGPMKVPPETLRSLLGITTVQYVQGKSPLAIVDASLQPAGDRRPAAGSQSSEIRIDNFSFTPKALTVPAGAAVTWTNHDDIPHTVVSTEKRFASPVLDTDERFTYRFAAPGSYAYFCSIHPHMTGSITVE